VEQHSHYGTGVEGESRLTRWTMRKKEQIGKIAIESTLFRKPSHRQARPSPQFRRSRIRGALAHCRPDISRGIGLHVALTASWLFSVLTQRSNPFFSITR